MVMIGAMVAAAAFTYTTKHDAEAELAKVRRLEAAIRFEEETMTVLRADWSVLTQPSRLQELADRYTAQLGLHPVEPYQFAELDELPGLRLRLEDLLEDDGRWAAGELDDMATGGVMR